MKGKKSIFFIGAAAILAVILTLVLGLGVHRAVQTRRLFLSIFDGDRVQAQLAIRNGANVNGHLHLFVLIPAEYSNPTPLTEACMVKNRAPIAYDLLDAGADPNLADSVTGVTPLFSAIHSRQYALAEALISRGADVSLGAKGNRGIALETLYDGCMDPSADDSEGHRLLLQLYELGAPVVENTGGKTVFHEAVIHKDVYALQFFLAREKELINQETDGGMTPLQMARSLAETDPSPALDEIISLLQST